MKREYFCDPISYVKQNNGSCVLTLIVMFFLTNRKLRSGFK